MNRSARAFTVSTTDRNLTAHAGAVLSAECLRWVPAGAVIRARFDSGFYSKDLFAKLEDKGVTYLCGVAT